MSQITLLGHNVTTDELAERAEQLGGFHNLIGYYSDDTITELAHEYVNNYIDNEDLDYLKNHDDSRNLVINDAAHFLADCYFKEASEKEDFNNETLYSC